MNSNVFKQAPLLLALLCAAAGIYHYWWVCDDAYISFRYALNWAEGLGLRYNPGDHMPIEGYSNFLWVVIAGLVERVGAPVDIWMPILSCACALVLIWRMNRVLIDCVELSTVQAGFVTLTAGVFPPFLVWSTSGLAPMPLALCLFLIWEFLFLRQARYGNFIVLLTAVILVLMRVEGVGWAFVLTIMGLGLRESRRRTCLYLLLPALIVFCGHLVFRYSLYGSFLPNTFHAKAGFSLAELERGAKYIGVFVLTFLSPLLVLVFAPIAAWSKHRKVVCTALLLMLGPYIYAVVTGGDFMTMGRFMVPAFAFQVIILGAVVQSLQRGGHRGAELVAATLIVGVFFLNVLPAFGMFPVSHSIRERLHFRLNKSVFFDEFRQYDFMVKNSRRWRRLGQELGKHVAEGDTLVAGAIGNVGYFSRVFIYDRFGLVTRIEQKPQVAEIKSSPGHDMVVGPQYFLNKNPTYLYAKLRRVSTVSKIKRMKNARYAPVLHEVEPLPSDDEKRVLMLMKFMPEDAKREQLWSVAKGYVQ